MANERLTGAFIAIYKVANADGTGAETLLGVTKDDVEIAYSENSAENLAHNELVVRQKPLSYGQEITFGGMVTTELQTLKDLGVAVGAAPEELRGFAPTPINAVRVKVYENYGDANPKHKILASTCEVYLESITYPQEDYATYALRLAVNGTIKRENGP